MPDQLVSIVIPTRNRAAFLGRAVVSVQKQTYPHLDIVIVDDASDDHTGEVVRDMRTQDSRVRYFKNEVVGGAARARNRGIREANGSIITFLDDDDEFLPSRIEVLLSVYNHGQWSFVCSDYNLLKMSRSQLNKNAGILDMRKMLWDNLSTNTVLTSRDRLEEVNGYDESLTAAQDWDLGIRLIALFGNAYRDSGVLMYVHQEHEEQRISEGPKMIKGYYNHFVKHRHRMTLHQRRYQLNKFRRRRGLPVGLLSTLYYTPWNAMIFELKHYMSQFTKS